MIFVGAVSSAEVKFYGCKFKGGFGYAHHNPQNLHQTHIRMISFKNTDLTFRYVIYLFARFALSIHPHDGILSKQYIILHNYISIG